MEFDSQKGAQVYTPLSLKIYDWWVLNISNTYAWQCRTRPILLDHFQKFMGENHMDIGVGTGFYLSHTSKKPQNFTLLDLNPNSLKSTSERIVPQFTVRSIQHDVFMPLPADLNNSFDSVSMFYLLHCLPGSMNTKEIVISNAASALKADGTLYGATILGSGVTHNKFGTKLMCLYNKKGIFNNWQDSADGLRAALDAHFREVDVKVCGTVALFSASGKIE
ncbi:class I SAM-dependent methyltransferase [Pantoea sp. Bo_2]|uniref:Class I SAM-dependent methyltransferase n=1 Tax=Candidatus Pantoea gossypiicola TaxID=2608008 RepID=A0AB34CC40_9GAMM|nr:MULTISPECIES: class I SAM-dependent methyltransferase [Pantoea]KAA5920949.1 class I SAM-dependent methyltransferase [Pantoea sp. VH_8]KAA5928484.1 class I SAM-dependent methyltransferase [Pantoea sp. VH_4]KAA5936412.1 class I SAM-dependent methyltransferase [Pantoea sp. VH_3]KAA5948120.1 class I SAM-dependent methyltransferase [Pantoea sp. VH_25]KAA5948539.1 class I SAM-dependent methyltransferase [Pantoea sp. VH_24]